MSLIAAGGWCAPSDRVYDLLRAPDVPIPSACPDWNDPDGIETCVSHSAWTDERESKGWHDCVDEYNGPHTVCKCTDCGAERIVMRES